jgi:RNA polymerase sigma-70 factor (ECF subfamily)
MPVARATTTTDALRDTFEALFDRHKKIVFKVANTYCRHAEDRRDLAQEICVQLWRAFPGYDPQRSFSTWMYRVALNVAISSLRSESRRARTFVPAEDEILALATAPAGTADIEGDLRAMWQAIDGLDALDRALLILYLDGQSHGTIAEVLGLSPTNVGTKIGRIKNRLRRDMSPAV